MSQSHAKTRLYVPDQLKSGAEIELTPDHAHFLGNVLRLKAGDWIALFNETDGEWAGPLSRLKKRAALVVLDTCLRPPAPEPGPWLAFAPLKKARMQMVVEKATELGVERILPVITENTNGGRVNQQRMAANALEAAEQCERLSVPEISAPQSLSEFLQSWPKDRSLLVGDETGTGRPIAEVITAGGLKFHQHGVLIGPEGGFQASELEQLQDCEFITLIDLGPRILRAETAIISALACIGALT